MSERQEYTTVRVTAETNKLIDRLIDRLAQRSYTAMPEEMRGRSRPLKIDVMHAAFRLLEAKMDAEDVGASVPGPAPE